MSIGSLLFYLCYVISTVLIYLGVFRIYNINTNIRAKTPLWGLLILLVSWFIPVWNLCASTFFFTWKIADDDYALKSILNKEY